MIYAHITRYMLYQHFDEYLCKRHPIDSCVRSVLATCIYCLCNALDDEFHTLSVENVTESCSADDSPHRVFFVQPEYRVMEDDGAVNVSVRLNGTSARADITVRVSARSTGNGDLDASGTCVGYAVNSVLCTAKLLGSCIYPHFSNSLFSLFPHSSFFLSSFALSSCSWR